MKKNNIRETFRFLKAGMLNLNEGVGPTLDRAVRGGNFEKEAADSVRKMMYKFGDFYPNEKNPQGIVVIEEGYKGQPLTIMSLTSYTADGTVSFEEERLTWDDAMKGAQNYSYNGSGTGWELPSVEQYKVAFDIEDSGDNKEAIEKIKLINQRIDEWNAQHPEGAPER